MKDDTAPCRARARGRGELRLLAVGNSFSLNATRRLPGLAAAAGRRLLPVNACIGGCDLERHARHAAAHEADPAGAEGRPYDGRSLRELLIQERWHIVTIQQASPKSFRAETFQPHADQLIAVIRRYAPRAEIVVHQTWAYRDDHHFWGMTGFGPDRMYAGLRRAYDAFARSRGLRLIPGGDAMQAARLDPSWGPFRPDPSFDPATAAYPALPAEQRSLHAGYHWRQNGENGGWKLEKDAFHANAQGEYLLACVWFEFLFGTSVKGNAFVPADVDPADAAILQDIAHNVVSEGKRPPIPPA